jgi:RNA polymerase sigma factor (sigma-70 family)
MMARLADGDRDAFAFVFGRLWPTLQAFARRLLGSEADADDVAQRALLSIMSRASEYDADRDALSWAIGITAWECRTLRRHQTRRRETAMPPVLEMPIASPEDTVIEHDLLRAVEHVLGELTPDDRAALGVESSPCDAPAATIRKRRQRALTRLRAAWSRLHAR